MGGARPAGGAAPANRRGAIIRWLARHASNRQADREANAAALKPRPEASNGFEAGRWREKTEAKRSLLGVIDAC